MSPPAPVRFLTLLRHAHAQSATSATGDATRALSERGRRDAAALRERLALPADDADASESVRDIDRVLCSDAARTRETLALLLPALGPAGAAAGFERALYLASADALGARADAAFDDGARHVLLVGHNPGLETLCARLLGAPGLAMQTCERIVLRLSGARTSPGSATLATRDGPDVRA